MPFNRDHSEGSIRQDVACSLHRNIAAYEAGVQDIPVFIIEAIQKQVWKKERIFAGGTVQEPMSLRAFVRARYPEGLGSTPERIREIIAHHPVALAAWDEALRIEG